MPPTAAATPLVVQDDELPDKRPEVKEWLAQLKGHVGERGAEEALGGGGDGCKREENGCAAGLATWRCGDDEDARQRKRDGGDYEGAENASPQWDDRLERLHDEDREEADDGECGRQFW